MVWLQRLKQAMRRVGPGAGTLLSASGVVLLLLSAGFGLHAWLAIRPLSRATATVSENISSFAPGGGVIYRPRLRFRTSTGELVQVVSPGGSEDIDFPAGTNLPVLYPANAPEQAYIATTPRVYPAALTLGILGVAVLDLGLVVLFLSRKHAKMRLKTR
jgi:hypothetical protein